jgi:hypothetical protein
VNTSLSPANFSPAWTYNIPYTSSGTGSWYEQGVTTDGTRAFVTVLEGYAPAGNYHVTALNMSNGGIAWDTIVVGRAFDGVSSPSYMNGTVYVNRAGHSGISGGTDADLPKLMGLNAVTGAVKFATPYSAQWGENFRPIPTGTQVFAAGGYYGGFYGYNATTGAQLWFNANTGWDPAHGAVAVDDQYVYIGPNLYNRATGTAAGSFAHPTAGGVLYTPVISGDQVFYSTSVSNSQRFAAFDRVTHQFQWEYSAPASRAAVGDAIVAFVSGNTLRVLNRADGSSRFAWNAPATLWDDLVLTRTHAFVTSGFNVYAVDLTSGQSVWTGPVGGELALSDGKLLVSNRSSVTAFNVPEPASGAAMIAAAAIASRMLTRRRRRRLCC